MRHDETEMAGAEVERLRADRDAAEARGYQRGLEAAAVRLEARATSEQITVDRLAPEYLRHVCMAMVLRDEASRIRALTPEAAPEQPAEREPRLIEIEMRHRHEMERHEMDMRERDGGGR